MILVLAFTAGCGTHHGNMSVMYDAHSGEVHVSHSSFLIGRACTSGFSSSGDLLFMGPIRDTIHVGLWNYYADDLLVARIKYGAHGNVLMQETSNFGQMYPWRGVPDRRSDE